MAQDNTPPHLLIALHPKCKLFEIERGLPEYLETPLPGQCSLVLSSSYPNHLVRLALRSAARNLILNEDAKETRKRSEQKNRKRWKKINQVQGRMELNTFVPGTPTMDLVIRLQEPPANC
ncbi:hypothetical protein KQX54_009953 [Cotesia glomerata]|uniref:Uncharacterized protein n=1 Tax=Cotesia glomerata TaxID=32391 RepID=A0AAV7I587_COTGL|nr:hypothetical protein KQX54_009953 [Cotesia glomerata]